MKSKQLEVRGTRASALVSLLCSVTQNRSGWRLLAHCSGREGRKEKGGKGGERREMGVGDRRGKDMAGREGQREGGKYVEISFSLIGTHRTIRK